MSEEINTSHLCTTEDAFEKFQAVSMYEEDEYISLSDIVPTQTPAPDFMQEICDIPYEDEVVLESNLEEQVCEVNSTIESGLDGNNMSGPRDHPSISSSDVIIEGQNESTNFSEAGHNDNMEAGHNDNLEAGHNDNIEAGHNDDFAADQNDSMKDHNEANSTEVMKDSIKSQTSRRGRKKKNAVTELTVSNELKNGTNMLSTEQSNESMRTPGQRRRGRPPKNVSKNNPNASADGSPPSELSEESRILQNTSGKKRGRPKKSNPDLQMTEMKLASEEDAVQDVTESNKTVLTEPTEIIPGKREKRPRLLSSEKTDNDLNESKDIVNNLTSNQQSNKGRGKRGRPKKKYVEETELNVEQPPPCITALQKENNDNSLNDEDDGDDVCLSQLKTSMDSQEFNVTSDSLCQVSEEHEANKDNKINESKLSEENMPCAALSTANNKTEDLQPNPNSTTEMTDFEITIDNVVSIKNENSVSGNEIVGNDADLNNLLVEDTSKRPTRRRARKPLHYDEGSDEDPFANVELSDDEPIGCKKKYYSDDEYIPGKNKKGKQTDSSDSDSDMELDAFEEITENKRKRTFKKSEGSPTKGAKRGRKSVHENPSDVQIPNKESGVDDVEVSLKPSVIKTNDDKKNTEFENFLAKKIQGTDIQIKKKSTAQPFEIPVIDPKEQKKTTEISTQTKQVSTSSAGVQTASLYDVPMKDNIKLTQEQSEKACEFLNSIVKTTSELGQLMTQKSDDFMKKKINTENVTDTFKMDYCVRKSFLLFKLAKHNLMQMEEDLAKQYDNFLNTHNLQQHREQPKVVTAAPKTEGSDSDCEIIETTVIQKPQKKTQPAPFNPKTVFLNKELSIKIAKKTPTKDSKPEDKKINIKGRHTVWINDSVMVKKVKPTQSFLAQDSRNKKPPDFVTIEMVNSFFKQFYRQKALAACAPYVSPEWLSQNRSICCYFFANADDISVSAGLPSGSGQCVAAEGNSPDSNVNVCDNLTKENRKFCPRTLFSLCTQVLQTHLNNNMTSISKINDPTLATPKQEYNPTTLYGLCVNTINISHLSQEQGQNDDNCESPPLNKDQSDQEVSECGSSLLLSDQDDYKEVDRPLTSLDQDKVCDDLNYKLGSTLKTLCYKQIVEQMFSKNKTEQNKIKHTLQCNDIFTLSIDDVDASPRYSSEKDDLLLKTHHTNGVKSLFTLCFDLMHSHMASGVVVDKPIKCKAISKKIRCIPKTLKSLTLKFIVDIINRNEDCPIVNIKDLPKKVKTLSDICFEIVTKSFSGGNDSTLHEGMTINSINTLTEEAYHNIKHAEVSENLDYFEDDDDSNFYDDETENNLNNLEDEVDNIDNATVNTNWLSQVQMKEFRSCYTPQIPLEAETNVQEPPNLSEIQPLITQVKVEPLDEFQEDIPSPVNIKTEPLGNNLDEMTVIPENIVTKTEYQDAATTSRATIQRQDSSSYDVNTFEAFVATNKMMHNLNEYSNDDEEIFSQSALRVRRQFEPDDLFENDIDSLLVPQTFEPMRIENNAKDHLMESSSDEDGSINNKKVTGKKKTERRPRGRRKKNDPTSGGNKGPVVVPPKEKLQPTNEIAILTRRMREKIRQEEKKVVTSESDNESENIVAKKGKQKEQEEKSKLSSKDAGAVKNSLSTTDVREIGPVDDEIQCSNVDSTEQINEGRNISPSVKNFTGFTAVDQNEITSYQKYVKYVYDQILPKVTEQIDSESQEPSVINPEDPVELLECEPAMPFFSEAPPGVKRKPGPKTKTQNINNIKKTITKDDKETKGTDDKNFIERHGWKCYPLNGNDTKLYQNAQIVLEKLPETFVQTYFMYQDIATKNDEDEEVNRLINLQTLNRSGIKDGKKNKGKQKGLQEKSSDQLGRDTNHERSRSISPTFSENADELTPSEDEGANVEDEVPPPVTKPSSDNHLAKNSLMDDNDSDADLPGGSKIKEEFDDDGNPVKTKSKKSKSKSKVEQAPPGPVMLTADKMMNKELNLLHAPITLDDAVEPTPSKGRANKHKQKSASKTSPKEHGKAEDDSSSEEEKHQWFTIKEKLLKRMVKKSDTTREDDAKRAKLVSEFIERRGDSSEAYIKRRGGRSRRVSKKKMLERQKQLKVLSRELFGDPSNDASIPHTKRSQQAYFKGRRNIRKVIDKKSLARSTVVANMEEFERKRRINIRQSRLREIMQCEDGVNVLVINDEVCLEYDFEANRPVVTVHPFFTKVMKAHQYEGVKFMWDACFESLESIAAGRPGGGCILAHCMGLGKTLQVLALLHTVLTHPRVGMQRVLVCCPLSTVLNWVDEIHKWIGPVTNQIKVFELSKLKKTSNRAYQLEDWYNGGGIFIIGYELFRSLTTLDPFLDDVRPAVIKKIRTALLDPGPDIIICDEGHLLKNDASVLAVAMSRVVTKRRIVLTGTPMQNNLREYYCMVNFVKPNLLGTYSEYSNRFENPIMNGQHRDSQEQDIKLMKARTHILHKVLEGCLQRQEASVLYPYLPKKHEYTVFISLTKCQWDLYKHYLSNYSNTQNNKSVLKDFHILQKIWSHPQVLHNFQNRTGETTRNKVKEEKLEDDLAREDLNATEDIKPADTEVWWLQYLEGGAMLDSLASSNKFAAVFRILEESIALEDKVLIFSTSLFTMDALEYFLKKINNWSLGQEYYRLDGSVPAEVRQKWCREFNAENNHKTKLFLISTRAGCLGLNMTAANRVIILDTSWNPAHDIQSIFRVYRFGQKKDCYIYRLVALGTMEQKIYERSVTKQAVACRVVDEQQIDRHYNMAELTELYKYDETGSGVAGGVAVGVEDVVLLRVARDSALHAVHEHDSLLRGSLEQGLPEHERDAAWNQFQEEHAHKQEMQEMPKPVKIKKVKVANQIPAAAEAVPASSMNWTVVKTENEESILPNDPSPDDFKPTVPRPKPKGGKKKRSGKNNVVSCCIPIQPETPEEEPATMDDDMVKKITHILIKHNYQNTQGPHEIAKLVSRVRSFVYSGNMDQLDSRDELTMSIARVLLGKDLQAMPPLTDIALEDSRETSAAVVKQENEDRPRPAPKSRGRPRRGQASETIKKGYVYEEVPTTSAPPPPEPVPDADGRRRRRAALAAEKNFESLPVGDPVIDIEDDDSHDNEFVPEIPIEYDGGPDDADDSDSPEDVVLPNFQVKTEVTDNANTTLGLHNSIAQKSKKTPKTYMKKKDSTKTATTQPQKNTAPLPTPTLDTSASILLSDDDDYEAPVVSRKKPGPARRTVKTEVVESQSSSSKNVAAAFEVIPLHPSLLSNKNFIKIVAHTYLSGNPMLDEDAATLAAQYSTFKALKEYEANGKNIDSGPIYDIAIKVLGADVLRKLHKSNVKLSTSDMLAQHPINSQDTAAAKDTSANSALKQALNVNEKKAPTETPVKKYTPGPASKKSTPVQSAQKSSSLPENKPTAQKQSQPAPSVTPVERNVPEKKTVIKIRMPASALASSSVPMPVTSVTASPASVVPVGLFKGAGESPATETQEECILPDDDDIRIVSQPPAPAPAPRVAAAPRLSTQPILLSSLTADTRHTYPITNVYSMPAAPAPAPAPQITSDLAAPISLDSDDDEPNPTLIPVGPVYTSAPPVPISLTAVPSSAIPPHMRSTLTPKVLQKVSLRSAAHSVGSPIILNSTLGITQPGDMQLGGPMSPSQYILVPNSFSDVPTAVPVSSFSTMSNMIPTSNFTTVPNVITKTVFTTVPTVVPADDYVTGPAVVPVALSKVNYTAQGTPQQNFTNVNPNMIQFDQPISVDNVGAEQVVETTPAAAKKGNKRMCKPGDILRITKGGGIEVLNRKDILSNNQPVAEKKPPPAEKKPPAPAVPVQTRTLRGSTEPTPIVPTIEVPETTRSTAPKTDPKNSILKTNQKMTPASNTTIPKASTSGNNSMKGPSSSVSTIESRSPSPSDIFKNVVHIEADNYASRVSSDSADRSAPVNKPSTVKRNVITINSGLVTNTPSGDSSAKPLPKKSSAVSNIAKTSTAKSILSSAKAAVSNAKSALSTAKATASNTKPSASVTKTNTSTYTHTARNTSKAATTPNKAKELILDSVDLTDLDYLPPVSVSKKPKPQPNTIVGTSKSIILCASGKAVAKPPASTKTTTAAKSTPKVEKAPPAAKTEVKKRPAPVDNSLAKKKKTEKPMTLKDFDIDDIDDIIELD